jgi:hypothetical protein
MTLLSSLLDSGVSAYLSSHANGSNLPSGITRPLYYADGSPLLNGALWLDISDPNLPTVREFYAPNSFDLSFDFSFQG